MNGFSRNPEIILPITPTPGRRVERFNFSRKSFSCRCVYRRLVFKDLMQHTRARCSLPAGGAVRSPHARFSGIGSQEQNGTPKYMYHCAQRSGRTALQQALVQELTISASSLGSWSMKDQGRQRSDPAFCPQNTLRPPCTWSWPTPSCHAFCGCYIVVHNTLART